MALAPMVYDHIARLQLHRSKCANRVGFGPMVLTFGAGEPFFRGGTSWPPR
jgi:hypothetical protein